MTFHQAIKQAKRVFVWSQNIGPVRVTKKNAIDRFNFAKVDFPHIEERSYDIEENGDLVL